MVTDLTLKFIQAKRNQDVSTTDYPQNVLAHIDTSSNLIINWEEDEKWIGIEFNKMPIGVLYAQIPLLIYLSDYKKIFQIDLSHIDELVFVEVANFDNSLFRISKDAKKDVFGRIWQTDIVDEQSFTIKELVYATK